MKINKKNLSLIVFLFVILLIINLSIAQLNLEKVESDVLSRLDKESEVNVIIKLHSRNNLMRDIILSNLNGDEFQLKEKQLREDGFVGYITRTSVFDKSQGNALDKIKDAGDYLIDGKINHSAFYGYVSYEYDDCKLTGDGEDQQEICETKIEEGVSLDKEVELLRQAVYELKTELCRHDDSYEFC